MTTGQWILLTAVFFAVVFGSWRAVTDGRFRSGARPVGDVETASQDQDVTSNDSVVDGTDFTDQLGERATLLQFSSAFCAPCRATRRVLEEISQIVPGVSHVEVDAESHLELVRELRVTRTPTTLVLDAAGREVTRAAGAPTKAQVLTALAMVK